MFFSPPGFIGWIPMGGQPFLPPGLPPEFGRRRGEATPSDKMEVGAMAETSQSPLRKFLLWRYYQGLFEQNMCEKTQNRDSIFRTTSVSYTFFKSQRYSEHISYLQIWKRQVFERSDFPRVSQDPNQEPFEHCPPEPLQDPVSILRRLGRWSQERLVWGLVLMVGGWGYGINKRDPHGDCQGLAYERIWCIHNSQQGFFDEWWSQRTRTFLTKRSTDNKEDRDKLQKFQLFWQWNDLIGRGK